MKIIIKFAKVFLNNFMKISPATKGLIISVIAVLFAFGVYFLFLAKKNYYLVDNPTGETYYFILNKGDEKIIAAGQMLKVNLNKGKNGIQVFDGKKELLYDSAFVVNKNRGLLNIAHQDYYINEQFYGYGLDKDSLLSARKTTVIDGKKYVNAQNTSINYTQTNFTITLMKTTTKS